MSITMNLETEQKGLELSSEKHFCRQELGYYVRRNNFQLIFLPSLGVREVVVERCRRIKQKHFTKGISFKQKRHKYFCKMHMYIIYMQGAGLGQPGLKAGQPGIKHGQFETKAT